MHTMTDTNVRLIASFKTWIEANALQQLHANAELEGMRLAVGFPDLHPGSGTPVGAAFVTETFIYPHLIGTDVGCGMSLFKTSLHRRDAVLDGWAEARFDLEHPWGGEVGKILNAYHLESTRFDSELGTLGGGNHFAELQAVEQIHDPAAFRRFGMAQDQLVLLVHSGSRNFGASLMRDHSVAHGEDGLPADTFAGRRYLNGQEDALRWARAGRSLIARRFAEALDAESECVWDGCHNSITARVSGGQTVWVHRKGASAADRQAVVIPGSCGSFSYLVRPIGCGAGSAWSLAHGAGRKWSRSESRLRMRERYKPLQLTQTPLGGRVVCEERALLYEEAPAAYKNIEIVIQDLVEAGLASVIATFRPLLTYKTRKLAR